MSTVGLPSSSPATPIPPRAVVTVQDRFSIPGWVHDLASYRLWALSDAYPQSGWISYLNGEIWVDPEMEEFLTHNQVKAAFTGALVPLSLQMALGRFVPDRMLLTNVAANLSTEPDGLFFLWAPLQSGKLRVVSTDKEPISSWRALQT